MPPRPIIPNPIPDDLSNAAIDNDGKIPQNVLQFFIAPPAAREEQVEEYLREKSGMDEAALERFIVRDWNRGLDSLTSLVFASDRSLDCDLLLL